jgi:hypothetical protein
MFILMKLIIAAKFYCSIQAKEANPCKIPEVPSDERKAQIV